MVKRCCAKSCFNSQLTHKIAYFGFPKNIVVAKEWAKLSGREDLLDKKIDNLTKYYLCSDHFTSQDFANPDVEDKNFLVLNRNANVVPLPTQFKDNLQENYENALKNSEKFINYSKKEGTETRVRVRKPRGRKRKSKEQEYWIKTVIEPLDLDSINIDGLDTREEVLDIREDGLDTREEVLDIREDSLDTREDGLDTREDGLDTREEFIEEIDNLCRLCARHETEMVLIFTENGELTPEALCMKIMPERVIQFNDGLPQQACLICLEKLQACVNTIDGFVTNQNLFLS